MVARNNSASLDNRLVVSVQLDMSTCLTVTVVSVAYTGSNQTWGESTFNDSESESDSGRLFDSESESDSSQFGYDSESNSDSSNISISDSESESDSNFQLLI